MTFPFFLTASRPPGADTTLASEEENARIKRMVVESNKRLVAEIATLHQEVQTYEALRRRLKK